VDLRNILPARKDIPQLRRNGEDPYTYIEKIIEIYGPEMKLVQQCVKAIGSGSSPWIQLSHFLLNALPRPISE
jgi:hypothetical protein